MISFSNHNVNMQTHYEKFELKNNGNVKEMFYEKNGEKFYRTLNNDEYHKLFLNLRPNIEFSLPDIMVQSFIKDGSIMPSFKKSQFFTNSDLDEMLHEIKKEMNITSLKTENKNKAKKNIQTQKNKKNTILSRRNIIKNKHQLEK